MSTRRRQSRFSVALKIVKAKLIGILPSDRCSGFIANPGKVKWMIKKSINSFSMVIKGNAWQSECHAGDKFFSSPVFLSCLFQMRRLMALCVNLAFKCQTLFPKVFFFRLSLSRLFIFSHGPRVQAAQQTSAVVCDFLRERPRGAAWMWNAERRKKKERARVHRRSLQWIKEKTCFHGWYRWFLGGVSAGHESSPDRSVGLVSHQWIDELLMWRRPRYCRRICPNKLSALLEF